MLNSAENEKNKYQQFKLISFKAEVSMKFFMPMNIKMRTIVGILIFISRKIFMLSWVEYKKKAFYDLGAWLVFVGRTVDGMIVG